MSLKYLASLDLTGNEIQNVKLQNLVTDPTALGAGHTYYNTATKKVRSYNGTAWVDVSDYVHPSDGSGSIATPLTGANVISSLTVNAAGHVSGTTIRALTAGDVGAATSGHTHTYANVMTSLTGGSSAATNGQLLIGDGTDFTKATLTAGANVTITSGSGTISIASTDTTYSATTPIVLTGTTLSHSSADGNLHVPATGTTNNGKVLKAGATSGSLAWGTLTATDVGLGNVTNNAQVKKSASSTSGNVVTWSGTSGDALGTGYTVETTLTGGTGSLPRADAVKGYVDLLLSSQNAMVFKGTLGTGGTITALPTTYNKGWTYIVITAATYASNVCEIGDLLIALETRAGSGNVDADWAVIQTNVNGAVTGPTSATADNIAVFNSTSGKIIKDGGVKIATLAPKASPALTGNPTAPTQAADNNSTRIATTAFVIGQAGSVTPAENGTAAVGTSLKYAREDHVHPTDTSRIGRYAVAVGDGTNTSYTVTHNLGTRDVNVMIYDTVTPYAQVYTDVEMTSTSAITVRFATAPTTGKYRVVVQG